MKRVGRLFGAVAGGLVACATWCADARAAGDPNQDWWTIETPHFRVHYARNTEVIAQRIADIAETVHDRMTPVLGHDPKDVTHIVITDNVETANGSATALPYNTVRLFVTAPDDMSPLSEYEDWHVELVTHEYTHILHTDNIGGIPAIANAILGKQFAPNQLQPRWILEGLAVLEESEHTGGGRNRSAIFDMYLRANVVEDHIAPLDVFTHTPRAWPEGNYWYLYGSRFLTWIQSVYGEQVMRQVAEDYGSQLVPYGINRSMRRATGKTYEELYDGWVAHLRGLYGAQIERAKALPGGLREGRRLTHIGFTLQRPRFVPASARRNPDTPELVFYAEDAHHRDGFYRMALAPDGSAREKDRELFVRAEGGGSLSFDAAGDAYFSSQQWTRNVYPYSDISRVRAGFDSPEGDEAARSRLTTGVRALDPDVSPDGRQVAFTINRRGTMFLGIADVTPEGDLGPPRVLVPAQKDSLAQTPRFSRDGRRVTYSSWQAGGYRDVRVVDLETGKLSELFRDRATDVQPSFSPDGKKIVFSSDRTGIPNIYAWDIESRKLSMVTNVRTGAFMPEISEDGKTLVYVGYTSNGFDLYAMPFDEASFTDAPPYVDDRPPPTADVPHRDWERHPYNALPTLRPFSYTLAYGQGNFGTNALTVTANGSDAIGLHGISAAITVDGSGEPQFSFGYTYGRLPFDLSVAAFRYATPRNDYRVGGQEPVYTESTYGAQSTISYTYNRPFDSFSYYAGYEVSKIGAGSLPVGRNLDPYAPIGYLPQVHGLVSPLRFGFSYSSTERFTYSVGNARGLYLSLSLDVAGKATASDYDFYAYGVYITKNLQMPWHPDHTLELHEESGVSGGTYPRRDYYYTGGFVQLPPIQPFQQLPLQGGFVLRGYPPYSYSGRQYHLGTVEYRFPIVYPERGISTLPFFFNRLAGAAFLDYGGAFDDLDVKHWRDQFHTSVGGELLFDTTLGYFLSTTARLGYAKGFSHEAYTGGKVYLVLSAAY